MSHTSKVPNSVAITSTHRRITHAAPTRLLANFLHASPMPVRTQHSSPASSLRVLANANPSSTPPGVATTVVIAPSPPNPTTAHAPVTFHYRQLEIPQTPQGIALIDITPQIRELIVQVGLQEGCVHVLSRHTTTALTINENELRLMDDVRQFLSRLAPAADPYLHNDLHLRPAPDKWPGGWTAWAQQEPRNAHSHLLSILLGNTLTVPVSRSSLVLGTWQSVLLVELDGPRPRTVGVQLVGHTAPN